MQTLKNTTYCTREKYAPAWVIIAQFFILVLEELQLDLFVSQINRLMQ